MSATSDMLPLPGVERIRLAHSPLVLTICQVQFSPVFSVADAVYIGAFQQAIQEQYPFASQSVQLHVDVADRTVQQTQSHQWEFSDREQTWKVVLGQTFLTLETRRYSDFGDFTERLGTLLEALIQHIRPTLGLRLGLRYVDELRGTGGRWTEVISRDLLGPLAVPAFRANAMQATGLQQILLHYPDNRGVTIFHGAVPTGTTVRPRKGMPEPEDEFYLLDCDVYQVFPPTAGLALKPEAICRLVMDFHEVNYRLFRWALNDTYLRSLREE